MTQSTVVLGRLHELLGVIRAAKKFRDDDGEEYVGLHTGPLIEIVEETIRELQTPSAVHPLSCEVLAESLKVALEHESTEARVLLGRLLTELERRTT